jgi:hypothetical protein
MLASTAVAAIADIKVGGGPTVGDPLRAATPTQVSPGNVAGYYLWIRNDDPANLSTFFMKAMTDSTPVGAYWSRNGETTTHTCGTGDPLVCDFGALNSGDEIQITAAFEAVPSTQHCLPAINPPANSGGFAPTTETSYACVDFQFGANSGFVEEKGKNKSRGDAYHWFDFAATDTGADRGATFPFCDLQADPTCTGSVLSVSNNAATRNNVQSTKVTAPAVDEVFNTAYGKTGLAVADNLGPDFDCADIGNLPTCTSHEANGNDAFVGQWSRVDVNSEQPLDPEYIIVELQMYGVNPNSIEGVVHAWFAVTWQERTVNDECDSASGPGPDQDECFWVSTTGQITTGTVWLHNNGSIRTF